MGRFHEEKAAQGGLAGGGASGNAYDVRGGGGKSAVLNDSMAGAGIGKGYMAHGKAVRLCRRQGRLRKRRQEITDAVPGNVCFLQGIEKVGRMGGFHRQPCKAGKVCGKGGNVPVFPALAHHIFPAQPENEEGTGHGNDPVERFHAVFPKALADPPLFIIGEPAAVALIGCRFFSIETVGQGMAQPVHGAPGQTLR